MQNVKIRDTHKRYIPRKFECIQYQSTQWHPSMVNRVQQSRTGRLGRGCVGHDVCTTWSGVQQSRTGRLGRGCVGHDVCTIT